MNQADDAACRKFAHTKSEGWLQSIAVLMTATVLTACGGSGGDGGPGPGSYHVGGSVTGLAGAGLAITNNGGAALTVSANGAFTFPTTMGNGASYATAISAQPTNPSQTCSVTSGSGTVSSADVTNIAISCTTNKYPVGGTVSGLSGSGLVLRNNGGDDVTVSANGTFVFATSIASGAAFNVTVQTQPKGPVQVCTVSSPSGTVAASAVSSVAVSCGPIALLAGALGQRGFTDGSGSDARFWVPRGLAVDVAGNVFVADGGNSAIRKITAGSLVSTVAGGDKLGAVDGSATAVLIASPSGIAVDAAGNVFESDIRTYTVRKITPAGAVSVLAGDAAGASGSADGSGGDARFGLPMGIALDSTGKLYVADSSNHTIRMISPGGVVSTFAGSADNPGWKDGTGTGAQFSKPGGLAVDSAGNVYVADVGNSVIRRITPDGVVTTVVGKPGQSLVQLGSLPGTLNSPYGVAVLPGKSGVTLLVTDEDCVLQIALP